MERFQNIFHATFFDFYEDYRNSALFLCILLPVCYLIWWMFLKPYNYYRDFAEAGFEDEIRNKAKNNRKKRDTINELRQRRKTGNIPPLYPNGWFSVLESDELERKTVKEINALGKNLVAWRGESGKCYVADAYCTHLGAHLGVGGTVSEECIQCPFHGWEFEGSSGKLKKIPYADSVPQSANLRTWTTLEMYGCIYIWYHAENQEPSWYPDYISEVETNQWKYRGRTELYVTCHTQEISENAADPAHLNLIHQSIVFAGPNPDQANLAWGFLTHDFSAKWAANEDSGRKHEAIMSISHCLRIFGKGSFFNTELFAHQHGPGIVLLHVDTIFGKGIIIKNLTTMSPLCVRVVSRCYSCPTLIQPFGALLLHSEAIQLARDIRIWNRKTYRSQPILTKEDYLIKRFRRWYSQFYSSDQKELKHAESETNDLSF